MSRFRISLGYGVLDQVVARVFDFATLWVVMRTLPEADLADYGIATAMMFVFSLVMLVPETALMRDKKSWATQNTLSGYLQGFLLFAEIRIAFIACLALIAGWIFGWKSPFFLACALALVNQLVQLAEIARLDFRIDLQQKQVFRAESVLKLLLLALVSVMFLYPGVRVYLALFLGWSMIGALYWCARLQRKYGVGLNLDWTSLRYPVSALRDFSLWQHLSGVVTYVIYNIDPWVLSWFSTDVAAIAVYTLALKISALFFTIPMFLQSMTTIFIVNCEAEDQKHRTFRRLFAANAGIAVLQFAIFVFFGAWLGKVFRGGAVANDLFYSLGIVLSSGVLVLNLVRPLIADLTLHAPMRRLITRTYLPALIVSLGCYGVFTYKYGAMGCAYASAISYAVFAALLLWQSRHFGVARQALLVRRSSKIQATT